MRNLIKEILLILFFAAVAVILPLIWIDKGYLFISEEDHFANYQKVIIKNSSSWDYTFNAGDPTHPSQYTLIFPNGLLYYYLSNKNIPNDIIQKIFLSLTIFVTLLASSYFIRLFTRNRLIILLIALFYYLNFYTKSSLFYSAKMYQLILMPLFFTYTYLFLKTSKFKYVIYNFLSLFVFQGIFSNLAATISTFLIYPLAIIYYYFSNPTGLIAFLKSKLLLLIVFFSFLIPLLLSSGLSYYLYVNNSSVSSLKSSNSFSALSSPINLVLQFRGSWWEFLSSAEGVSYNSWRWFYGNFFIVLISYFLLALGLRLLLEKKFTNKYLFFTVIFIISVFLSSGSAFFPKLYSLFYNHIPFFYVFREPWSKFTPLLILSLAVLITLSLENISKFYKKKLIIFCIILVLIRGIPFLTPYFFDKHINRWSIPFIKLPHYWLEWQKWSIFNRDKTVLLKPINYFKRNWYKQNYGNANHPIASIFGYTNTIFQLKINALGEIIDYFINNDNNNFIKLISIDYLLDQQDVENKSEYFSDKNKAYNQKFMQFFQEKPIINFDNKLFLYPIKPEFKLPLVYQPKKIFLTNGVKGLEKIVSNPDYQLTSVIYYYKNILGQINLIENLQDELNNNTNLAANLKFTKINDERYEISFSHITKPTILIFNTSFNKSWQLIFKNNLVINNKYHLLANGYANSWIIDPKQICTTHVCRRSDNRSYDLDLIMEYKPEDMVNKILVTNLVICSGGILYLVGYFIFKLFKHD